MRAVIGLIGLGVVGGVAPTGLAGVQYAAIALASTLGALLLLIAACVAWASLARSSRSLAQSSRSAAPAPPLALRRAASTGSAPRSI